MFTDTISVTVDSVQRDHVRAWDKDFQAEIAKGNTAIRKAALADGESLHRISHSSPKVGRERHLEQMVETVIDASGIERVRKVHIIIEHDDAVAERSAVALLANGFITSLTSTNVTDLLGNSL